MKKRLSDDLRILSAFALKDIRDAIQNKLIVRVWIGTMMVWLSAMALPLLLSMRKTLEVRLHDPGRSEFVRELAKDEQLEVRRVRSEQELRDGVGGNFSDVLGLKIVPEIDDLLDSSEQVTITGYYPHWLKPEQVAEFAAEVEARMELVSGRPVLIDLSSGVSYPSYKGGGRPTMISNALVIVIFTVGGMLTPFLMIEEKEKGTLAAIMVSPASVWHFVLGKALAGLFYSVIVTAVALSMSGRWIVHWDLAILAALAGSLFTVSIGLLVGVYTDNPASMGLWFGLFMMIMLIPVFLEFSLAQDSVSWWQVLLRWLPTVAFSDLLQASFASKFPSEISVRSLVSMLGTTGGLLMLVAWRLRRMGA